MALTDLDALNLHHHIFKNVILQFIETIPVRSNVTIDR